MEAAQPRLTALKNALAARELAKFTKIVASSVWPVFAHNVPEEAKQLLSLVLIAMAMAE